MAESKTQGFMGHRIRAEESRPGRWIASIQENSSGPFQQLPGKYADADEALGEAREFLRDSGEMGPYKRRMSRSFSDRVTAELAKSKLAASLSIYHLGRFDPDKDYSGKFCFMFHFEDDHGLPDLHCTHKYLGEADQKTVQESVELVDGYFQANKDHVQEPRTWSFDLKTMLGEERDVPVLLRLDSDGMLAGLKQQLDSIVPDKFPFYRPHITIPDESTLRKVELKPIRYALVEGGTIVKEWPFASHKSKEASMSTTTNLAQTQYRGTHNGVNFNVLYEAPRGYTYSIPALNIRTGTEWLQTLEEAKISCMYAIEEAHGELSRLAAAKKKKLSDENTEGTQKPKIKTEQEMKDDPKKIIDPAVVEKMGANKDITEGNASRHKHLARFAKEVKKEQGGSHKGFEIELTVWEEDGDNLYSAQAYGTHEAGKADKEVRGPMQESKAAAIASVKQMIDQRYGGR